MSSFTISLIGAERMRAQLDRIVRPAPELVKGMRNVADQMVRRTMEDKLSGQVLNVRTGRLRRSITRKIEQPGGDIEAIVGTNVVYGRIHEYGGVIHHPPRQMLLRHRLVRRRVRTMIADARGYDQHLPARSFLRSTLSEMRYYAETRIRSALQEALLR
jgi:phage gpG-like protein